jgi:hypothetical protein
MKPLALPSDSFQLLAYIFLIPVKKTNATIKSCKNVKHRFERYFIGGGN